MQLHICCPRWIRIRIYYISRNIKILLAILELQNSHHLNIVKQQKREASSTANKSTQYISKIIYVNPPYCLKKEQEFPLWWSGMSYSSYKWNGSIKQQPRDGQLFNYRNDRDYFIGNNRHCELFP